MSSINLNYLGLQELNILTENNRTNERVLNKIEKEYIRRFEILRELRK